MRISTGIECETAKEVPLAGTTGTTTQRYLLFATRPTARGSVSLVGVTHIRHWGLVLSLPGFRHDLLYAGPRGGQCRPWAILVWMGVPTRVVLRLHYGTL